MTKAYEGILIECDAAIKQYILHLDEQEMAAGSGASSFVVHNMKELSDTRILVKQSALEFINDKIEELQASNSFSRPQGATDEAEAARATKKPKTKHP